MALQPAECTLPNGLRVFYLQKTTLDVVAREIFEENPYFRHGILVQDGDCIVDAGANIGMFLLYLNQFLQDAIVHAFEPIPETFEVLERNVQRHNHLRVELSSQTGVAKFTHFPRSNVGSTMFPQTSPEFREQTRRQVADSMRNHSVILKWLMRITPQVFWWPIIEAIRIHYQKAEQVTCQLRTLSEVIDQRQLTRIDLLKIDVEGAEQDVLRGIQPHHWLMIRQLVIEVHHGQQILQEIDKFLRERHFAVVVERPLAATTDQVSMVYAKRVG